MTIENIKKQINKIESIKKARQAHKEGTLKINWETDIEKIDFLKLKSQPIVNGDKAKIENVEIPIYMGMKPEKDSTFDDMLDIGGRGMMFDLLQVVMSGEKVIPPVYYRHLYIVDGVAEVTYPTIDGAHRILLSRFLGLKEIPMVVEDKMLGYKFSPDKWTFKKENEILTVSRLNGKEVYNFNLTNCLLDEGDENFICLMIQEQ